MKQQKISRYKRILALFICFTMFVSTINAFSIVSLAADDSKANIDMVYLGNGETPNQEPVTTLPKISEMEVGDRIWIGIKLSNLTKIDTNFTNSNGYTSFFYADTAQGEAKGTAGIFSLATGINYDSQYIKPVSSQDYGGNETENLGEDIATNLFQEFPHWNAVSERYSAEVTISDKSQMDSEEPTVLDNSNNTIKNVFFNISSNNNLNRVFNTSLEDDLMAIVVAFEVVSVPSAGTKLIETALNAHDFVIETGLNGQRWGAQWNKDESVTADSNLKNYLNAGSFLNINPATYGVTFYNDSALGSTVGTAVTVEENGKVAVGDIPDSSNFAPAAGKFFKGLKYTTGATANPDGDADFDENVVITADTKVYAVYEDGRVITFKSNYPNDAPEETKAVTISPVPGTTIAESEMPTVGKSGDTPTPDFIVPNGYVFKGWFDSVENGNEIIFGDSGTTFENDKDVYAQWTNQIKVEFFDDNETTTTTPSSTVYLDPPGGTVGDKMPGDPSARSGYKFDGWYYMNSGTETKFESTTTVSQNTKVYGKWTQQFTVEFYSSKADATGGTSQLTSETVEAGGKISQGTITAVTPSNVNDDVSHKYFQGWKVEGSNIDFDLVNDTIISDLKLYQEWVDYYEIKFYKETTDINNTVYETKYVNPNVSNKLADADFPANPTKDNHGFSGWKIYNGTVGDTFNSNYEVSSNLTIVAEWTEKVKITFHNNDGTDAKTDVQVTPNVTFDGAVPTITRTNYTLKEWNTKANGTGTVYTSVENTTFTEATDLYAIWIPEEGQQTATLTFDTVGGVTANPSSITVVKGDAIYAAQMPETPTKTSLAGHPYTFEGWFEEATLSNEDEMETPITLHDDDTAYAHWSYSAADRKTVTFNDNDATTAVNPTTVTVGAGDTIGAAMPTNPAKTDNTFGGWFNGNNEFKNDTIVTDDITVIAKWVSDITVTYDANGGTDAPSQVKKPATDKYVDPNVESMVNGTYTFVGWNTKQNGSGNYVKADGTITYADVAGDNAAVTLYAQWAAVPNGEVNDVITDNPADPDPAQNGVKVTFDNNAAGATSVTAITADASPKYKYPKLGDAIGANNMPTAPTREKYKFKSWNTKQDGSGTEVTGTTLINTTLDTLTAIAGTNTSYEITLYAQWEVADDVPENEKVKITLNKNLNGDGEDTSAKTITLYKGDALGYDVADPTNGNSDFVGWYTGSVEAGKVVFTNDNLTSTTVINADVVYYAKWQLFLVVTIDENNFPYIGVDIKPTYKVYKAQRESNGTYTKEDDPIYSGDFSDTSEYTVKYTKDSTASNLINIGNYVANVTLSANSTLAAQGAEIGNVENPTITVEEALLTVKVDPDTQIQKSGDSLTTATVNVEGIVNSEVPSDIYDIKYYKWTDDATADGAIQDSELSEEPGNPEDVGYYVIKVELKANSNYKIDSTKSTTEDKQVLEYPTSGTGTTYPVYADGKVGQKIVYQIQASDPSAESIVVKPVKEGTAGNALQLKDSNYTTDVTFDNAEEPTLTEYYVRTDKDTDSIEFTITLNNPDTTTVTSDTQNVTVIRNDDQTYTVTLSSLANTGVTPNDIVITSTADGTETSIDYTFHIQKTVAPKIELNYGNSPYGEIMKDNNIADKQAAKDAFNASNQLSSLTNLPFYDDAWNSYLTYNDGLAYNGDKDDTSIFVYQRKNFKDPGFKIYNGLGENITDTAVVNMSLAMTSFAGGVVQYSANDNIATITETATGNNHVFTKFTDYNIRPDVYKLNYSFTDPISGEDIEKTRFVIAISKLGDVRIDANDIVNNLDASAIKTNSTILNTTNSLYCFRIADAKADGNKIINNLDSSEVKSKSISLPDFYKALPTE